VSPSMGELTLLTQIRWLALPDPTLEYRFDPRRRWRFDFAFPLLKVAVEVEGGSWTAGRHTRGSGFEADCEKYAEAAIAGWLVIRVTTEMVEDGRAVAFVERAITARKGSS
jgi:very-short-patch-repair endonuclease